MEIFIRKWSEISGGRFDPNFYRQDFMLNKTKLQNLNAKKLNDLVTFSNQTYIFEKENFNNTFNYIEISGINLADGNITATTLLEKDAPSRAKMLIQENDIIISSTRPNRGAITIIPKSLNGQVASTGFIVIRETSNEILRKYLLIALKLNFSLLQMEQRSTGGNYPAIIQSDLGQILIPLPPKEIQQHIIDIMDNAYLEKRRKESEAQAILDSIDDFLLGELGITLPPKATSDLQSRIFFVNLSEISGARFDAEYHQHYYTALQTAIHQGKYEVVSVSSVIKNIKKGIEVGSNEYTKEKQIQEIPFVRVSDITSNGINFESVDKFITRSLYEKLKADFQPQENELLYSKDGTIGICLESDSTKEYIISGAIVRIVLHSSVNRVFFQNLISLNAINELTNREAIGAVIKHLTIDKFLHLKIPLPPLSVQESIAEEISKRKNKALALQTQAKSILDSAKSTIEQIILS